jgi:hypothetical protein
MKERQNRSRIGQAQQQITKAVTHIRLGEVNAGKLVALDALASVYLTLSQQYVTLFCIEERPNKFRAPLFSTPLSERWHRVAIQQAAGIAHSWRSNREQAYQDYVGALATYQDKQRAGTLDARAKEPHWREWQVPTLKQPCVQANVNVVALEVSQDSTFDYWLRVSILEKGKPLRVPVKLAEYHRRVLAGKTINSSVQLNRQQDGTWWLTLSYDEIVPIQTAPDAPVIGIDVALLTL